MTSLILSFVPQSIRSCDTVEVYENSKSSMAQLPSCVGTRLYQLSLFLFVLADFHYELGLSSMLLKLQGLLWNTSFLLSIRNGSLSCLPVLA